MRHIIVDGYNVIRADARLQSLERVSLDTRARCAWFERSPAHPGWPTTALSSSSMVEAVHDLTCTLIGWVAVDTDVLGAGTNGR